jgi:hypothetical protein
MVHSLASKSKILQECLQFDIETITNVIHFIQASLGANTAALATMALPSRTLLHSGDHRTSSANESTNEQAAPLPKTSTWTENEQESESFQDA